MNKIVREHYPASRLPEELRAGLPPDASVTVTVEEERMKSRPNPEALLSLIREAQANSRGTTMEEAVARIRALRDEWDASRPSPSKAPAMPSIQGRRSGEARCVV